MSGGGRSGRRSALRRRRSRGGSTLPRWPRFCATIGRPINLQLRKCFSPWRGTISFLSQFRPYCLLSYQLIPDTMSMIYLFFSFKKNKIQAVAWQGGKLQKVVILTARLLSDAHRYILRCLRCHPSVKKCTIYTSISQVFLQIVFICSIIIYPIIDYSWSCQSVQSSQHFHALFMLIQIVSVFYQMIVCWWFVIGVTLVSKSAQFYTSSLQRPCTLFGSCTSS